MRGNEGRESGMGWKAAVTLKGAATQTKSAFADSKIKRLLAWVGRLCLCRRDFNRPLLCLYSRDINPPAQNVSPPLTPPLSRGAGGDRMRLTPHTPKPVGSRQPIYFG
jgi:hypothetical protein